MPDTICSAYNKKIKGCQKAKEKNNTIWRDRAIIRTWLSYVEEEEEDDDSRASRMSNWMDGDINSCTGRGTNLRSEGGEYDNEFSFEQIEFRWQCSISMKDIRDSKRTKQ